MKKVISLFALVIFFNLDSFCQGCLPSGIIFETQTAIDSFPTYYPGCHSIEGSVTIQKDGILNLDSLKVLTAIKGDLTIEKTSQLISLHGLDNLDSIGGDLNIRQNQLLTDLTALSLLDTIRGDLLISQNNQLTELTGLDSIKLIIGGLNLSSNPALLSLDIFQHLKSIGDQIIIQSNSRLKHLYGLEGITFHDGVIYIARNDSLLDYQGLNNLVIEKGRIFLVQNPMALDFTGFGSLQETGDLELYDLPCRDLNGFNQLAVIKSTLSIGNNSKLESFSGLPLLHEIQAYLHIVNNDHIQNLEGLEPLEEIFGLILDRNDSLVSLEGLNGLSSVTTSIQILDNAMLQDLSALNGTHGLGSDLRISGNDNLQSLYGLDHLCETHFFNLIIEDNPNLSVCNTECICAHLMQGGMSTIDGNSPGCNTSDEILAACMVKIDDPDLKFNLEVYPNPAFQLLEIKGLTQESFHYSIFDVVGNYINQGITDQPILDIHLLPAGMYLLEINAGKNLYSFRFIKM